MYCPTIGKPKMPKMSKIKIFSGSLLNKKLKMAKLGKLACENPMKGQIVTYSGVPIRPLIHLPNTISTNKLSGYAVNLFFSYAKYFKFKPKVIFSRNGAFISYNKTFTPGSFNAVRNKIHFSLQQKLPCHAVKQFLLISGHEW